MALHNLEEGIWWPGWAAAHARYLPWHPRPLMFRSLLLVLTVAAYLVTELSVREGLRSAWTPRFVAYAAIMLLNVFVPHLAATIYFRAYTPGVVTACSIVLPVTGALVIRAVREGALPDARSRGIGLGVPVLLAVAASVFFAKSL